MFACSEEDQIKKLLISNKVSDRIQGTYKAGLTGNEKYVPFLLKDMADPGASTLLRFKGFTVYTQKMYALERILKVKPPKPYGGISREPDSVNIKFYQDLWNNKKK